MADIPLLHLTVDTTPITEAMQEISKMITEMGGALKKAFPGPVLHQDDVVTPGQIAGLFDVPVHMLGTGVLPPGQCPTVKPEIVQPDPYGVSEKLAQLEAYQPVISTTAHQAVLELLIKGEAWVPKKLFTAHGDGEGSGIKASEVYGSDGAIKPVVAQALHIAPIDAEGNLTDDWEEVGYLTEDMEITYAVDPSPSGDDTVVMATGGPVTNGKLPAMTQHEKTVLGDFLGVTIGPDHEVKVWPQPGQPGALHIRVFLASGHAVWGRVLTPTEVQQLAESMYAKPQLKATPVIATHEQAKAAGMAHLAAWQHDWKPVGHVTVSDHASGLAMDFNFDPPVAPKPQVYNVLGKAHPVVVQPPQPEIHSKQSHAGVGWYAKGPDGLFQVVLNGVVHGANGSGVLQETLILTSEDQAKMLVGELPPGPEFFSVTKYLNAQKYVWSPEHSEWLSYGSEHASALEAFPTVSTGALSVSDEPITVGLAWDGVIEDPGDADLFADENPAGPPEIPEQGHMWCTAHECHWLDPTHPGDLVSCDSGGWLRKSDPLEDKLVLRKREIFREAGLLPQDKTVGWA